MLLDVVAVLLIVYGFVTGYKRGLINTVFDTLSLIIGIVAALKLSPIVINLLDGILPFSSAVNFIIGLVLTFVLVMLIIKYIGDKLEDIVETVNLGIINKVAGGALMGLFFALCLSYVFYFGVKSELISEKVRTESITYPMLEPLPANSQKLFERAKPAFSGFWDKMMETFDSIKEKGEEISN